MRPCVYQCVPNHFPNQRLNEETVLKNKKKTFFEEVQGDFYGSHKNKTFLLKPLFMKTITSIGILPLIIGASPL